MDLLSICIPTYNRRDRLRELLKKLCLWNVDNIKIIVVDNASTDGTDKMIKEFAKYKNLLYFRNDINLGADGNFFRIIEEGKKYSKYSLWLGDDDCVTREFFEDIPKILESNKPNVVILNYYLYNNNFIKRWIYMLGMKKRKAIYEYKNNYIEKDLENLFRKTRFKMPFGTIIMSNSLIELKNTLKYKETYHLYSGAMWEGLDKANKENGYIIAYITKKSYISWGKGEKSYNINKMDKIYEGIIKWYVQLPISLKSVAEETLEIVVKENRYGMYSEKVYNKYIENIKNEN